MWNLKKAKTQPPLLQTRIEPPGNALATTRDYSLHTQVVMSRAQLGEAESLYAVLNMSTGVIEGRALTLPDAINHMMALQTGLNMAKQTGSGELVFL